LLDFFGFCSLASGSALLVAKGVDIGKFVVGVFEQGAA